MGAYDVWLASVLTEYLRSFARQHQLGEAVQEMLFDLSSTLQRQRRPDVAFVSYDRWPRQQRVPRTEAWDVVPNLAVEVVSPTARVDALMDKVAEYFRAGVEGVWVVLPAQQQVHVYDSPTSVRSSPAQTPCVANCSCRTSNSNWLRSLMRVRRPQRGEKPPWYELRLTTSLERHFSSSRARYSTPVAANAALAEGLVK